MVICIVALVVFSILSIWSAKYRDLSREAFRCVARMITLRPCDVHLETRIKTKVTSKLMFIPKLAGLVYKHWAVMSWLFTIAFFASLGYSLYSVYNLLVYGSCTPGNQCVITSIGACILDIEKTAVGAILTILVIALLYIFIKNRKQKAAI